MQKLLQTKADAEQLHSRRSTLWTAVRPPAALGSSHASQELANDPLSQLRRAVLKCCDAWAKEVPGVEFTGFIFQNEILDDEPEDSDIREGVCSGMTNVWINVMNQGLEHGALDAASEGFHEFLKTSIDQVKDIQRGDAAEGQDLREQGAQLQAAQAGRMHLLNTLVSALEGFQTNEQTKAALKHGQQTETAGFRDVGNGRRLPEALATPWPLRKEALHRANIRRVVPEANRTSRAIQRGSQQLTELENDTKAFQDARGSGLNSSNVLDRTPIAQGHEALMQQLSTPLRDDGFYRVSLFSNSGGGHVLGLVKSPQGFRLMDPNTGEFKAKESGQLDALLAKHLEELYLTNDPDASYHAMDIVHYAFPPAQPADTASQHHQS
ncbi:hypothetical protein JGU66_30210 [Myxococcaceae bacterium JPH2]|nr:hypothetical protein [Myxococcaceae bacterium JPH2]